jgi:hypothetical protein
LRLLDIVLDSHALVLSRFILDEVERILLYPRIQARYRITASEAALHRNLADAAHPVEPIIIKPAILSDPADAPVLYAAADGEVLPRRTDVLRRLWDRPRKNPVKRLPLNPLRAILIIHPIR